MYKEFTAVRFRGLPCNKPQNGNLEGYPINCMVFEVQMLI